MAADIIWYITMFGCAALIFGIGVYANKLEKPMWFWSGSEVDAATITDVKAYNRENSRMWLWYSVWYWIAGFAWIWSAALAMIALTMGCTVGIVILVRTYLRIEKIYKKNRSVNHGPVFLCYMPPAGIFLVSARKIRKKPTKERR